MPPNPTRPSSSAQPRSSASPPSSAQPHSSASPPGHLYTLGHSTRTFEEFLAVVRAHKITAVADVREHPRSAHNPHFDRVVLAYALAADADTDAASAAEAAATDATATGISYHWLGRELGGFRQTGYRAHMATPLFIEGVARLLAVAGIGMNQRPAEGGAQAAPAKPSPGTTAVPDTSDPSPSQPPMAPQQQTSQRVVILCAEFKWYRCHRRYLADWLVARGHRVTHILDAERTVDHAEGLMGEARVGCDRRG